jgi:anionic cell wall polymer biosynthesis LytR-Cps2A-Psr (LCP) family protein
MGGVTVEVKKPLTDHFPDPTSPSGWAYITLPEGPRHMDGRMALTYSRSRMTTSDFDRSERQQEVLMALWRQAFTMETLVKAPQLWGEFSDSLETDLTMVQAVQLAYYVHGIGLENVRAQSLNVTTARPWTTPGGAQVLLPDAQAIHEIVMDLLYGIDDPS